MMYTGIFDTHAHYDDECFDEDRFELLDEMLASDVSGIINCGCANLNIMRGRCFVG